MDRLPLPRSRISAISCCRPDSTDPTDLLLEDDNEMSPTKSSGHRSNLFLNPPNQRRGRSPSSHSTTSSESGGPLSSPFQTSPPDSSTSLIFLYLLLINECVMASSVFLCSSKELDEESDGEEFSSLAIIPGMVEKGMGKRQMSEPSPRKGMKGRSPSAPSLGARKGLKRMDSTMTTTSETSSSSMRTRTSSNTSTTAVPETVHRTTKTLDHSQMRLYMNKANRRESVSTASPDTQPDRHSLSGSSFASGSAWASSTYENGSSPSSSSMSNRPDTSMSRVSRVVTVTPKTSMTSDRRSVSSFPGTNRSAMKDEERQDTTEEAVQRQSSDPSLNSQRSLPYVDDLVWQIDDILFIGPESVATNPHVLCRLSIQTTVELSDGPELEDTRKCFDCPCFCSKQHSRQHVKIRCPETETDMNSMVKKNKDGEPLNLVSLFDIFYDKCMEAKEQKKRVLVYSRRGRNRAPAFAVAYMMKTMHWNRRQAQEYVDGRMSTMRPPMAIHSHLLRALLKWQMHLNIKPEEPAALSLKTMSLFTVKKNAWS